MRAREAETVGWVEVCEQSLVIHRPSPSAASSALQVPASAGHRSPVFKKKKEKKMKKNKTKETTTKKGGKKAKETCERNRDIASGTGHY